MIFSNSQINKLEIVRSEIKRIRLLLVALGLAQTILIINWLFFNVELLYFFKRIENYLPVVLWLLSLILLELSVYFYLKRVDKNKKHLSNFFHISYLVLEISFPSILLFYMVQQYDVFIDSPLFVLYFLIIILSTLHLNFVFSFLTGFLSSIQYTLIIFYVFSEPGNKHPGLPLPEFAYYLRCILLLFCGIVAGFVAEEIKKRITLYLSVYQAKTEIELTLGQQVSEEIANALAEQGDEARSMEVTVMAMDIRNFSGFAEKHSPDEILAFQNKIFAPILNIISQHYGVVNQILGDGIMATFGVPASSSSHSVNAFLSAMEIRKKVKELSDSGIIHPTRIGIGLHTGQVVTGNIGNEIRKQYSISGTTVIIAFRIEQLNKELESDILISGEVRQKIEIDAENLIYVGKRFLKGFDKEIDIYKVE